MKKLCALALCLALCVGLLPSAAWAAGPEVKAKAVLLMEKSTEILYEEHGEEPLELASVTKVMTMLLIMEALEDGTLTPDTMVAVSANAAGMGGSQVYMKEGETFSVHDMLKAIAVASGNDACVAMAEHLAGSEAAFVERMNEKAAQLGMGDSHFANPHGYHDEGHYTTAYDLALLARAGMSDPDFCRIVTCLSYTLPPTSKRDALTLRNEYEIFDPASELYLPYAAGIKSGYTSRAGFCYVGAAQQDGRSLIAVVLGAPSRNRAWKDLQKLFEYGFSQP